jgi:hypothetical protein
MTQGLRNLRLSDGETPVESGDRRAGATVRRLLFPSTMRFTLAAACLFAALPALADPLADMAGDVARAEAARAEVEARRAPLAQKNADEGKEIERLKAQTPGVARDYRLGQLLSAAQDRAAELDRLQSDLRARDEAIAGLRQKLVAECDRVAGDPQSTPAMRADAAAKKAAELAKEKSATVEIARPSVDPLDGSQELTEKADLLRDSEDRLRKEVDRIGKRIESVENRRRLRERANAIDDDLFIENGSGRRTVHVGPVDTRNLSAQDSGNNKNAGGTNSPAPAQNFGFDPQSPSSPGGASESRIGASLRGALDPQTLDELRRAEAGQDLDRQLRALKKMQTSLRGVAEDLARRETDLRNRARDIKPRK